MKFIQLIDDELIIGSTSTEEDTGICNRGEMKIPSFLEAKAIKLISLHG